MRGLSCYTAGLHAYLGREWNATAVLARSVRLAIWPDPPGGGLAFSHHDPPLDRLPDGTALCYRAGATPAAALAEIRAELDRYGRVLVVCDAARLPWSVTRDGAPAPHWVLLDAPDATGWRVEDAFDAALPHGDQEPFVGRLSTAEVADLLTLPDPTLPGGWNRAQHRRNRLAFGAPVPVPLATVLWLSRSPDRDPAPADPPLVTAKQVLPVLAERLADDGDELEAHLDDLWAVAGHQRFALTHAGGEPDRRAVELWDQLPRLLRLAVESRWRGRPRPGLVRSALEALLPVPEAIR